MVYPLIKQQKRFDAKLVLKKQLMKVSFDKKQV